MSPKHKPTGHTVPKAREQRADGHRPRDSTDISLAGQILKEL